MKKGLVIGSLGLLGLLVGCSQEAETPVDARVQPRPGDSLF